MALTLAGRPRRAKWSGPPSPAAATDVQWELQRVLTHWRLPEELVDDAVLVAAELLANVVQHARTPFRLVAELRAQALYLAVDDELNGKPPAGTGATVPGHYGGLRMVNQMALRWGWHEHAAGKTVWAELLV